MKRTQSFFHQIIHLFSLLAGVMLIIILGIQLFAQQPLQFAYPSRSLVSNLALYPVALAAIAGLFALRNRRLSVLENRWFIRALFLITLTVQFLVARTCWYHLGWDPGTVHATAEEIARGLPISDYDYFVSCPNNAPLTALLAVPLWAAVKIGLGVPYVVLPYIDAVILNVTAYVCFKCVEKITQNSASRLLALGLSLGWIALSPYIIFPYTDVYAIFFPVMALYLFLARLHWRSHQTHRSHLPDCADHAWAVPSHCQALLCAARVCKAGCSDHSGCRAGGCSGPFFPKRKHGLAHQWPRG